MHLLVTEHLNGIVLSGRPVLLGYITLNSEKAS